MRDVKILCLIVTYPARHVTHALPVHRTWARRCTQTIFITNYEKKKGKKGEKGKKKEVTEKSVVLQPEDVSELFFMRVPDTSEGKDGLWNKTKVCYCIVLCGSVFEDVCACWGVW